MKTEKQHNKAILCFVEENKTLKEKIVKLEKELEQSRDLKTIIQKLAGYTDTLTNISTLTSSGGTWVSAHLPDNVLVYVDDILGGKVIKQEGVKCLVIGKDGTVKTGLTKQEYDKGFTYKLVRK